MCLVLRVFLRIDLHDSPMRLARYRPFFLRVRVRDAIPGCMDRH